MMAKDSVLVHGRLSVMGLVDSAGRIGELVRIRRACGFF